MTSSPPGSAPFKVTIFWQKHFCHQRKKLWNSAWHAGLLATLLVFENRKFTGIFFETLHLAWIYLTLTESYDHYNVGKSGLQIGNFCRKSTHQQFLCSPWWLKPSHSLESCDIAETTRSCFSVNYQLRMA